MARISQIVYNAIKFYAEPGNWTKDPDSGLDIPEAPAFLDAGMVAKDVMALIEQSPKTHPMTLAQAVAINENMVRLALYGDGIVCAAHAMEAGAALKDVTLDDMLEARNILNAVNQLPVATGEAKTLHVICDPRLIAAMYCTLHYTPGSVLMETVNCVLSMTPLDNGPANENQPRKPH